MASRSPPSHVIYCQVENDVVNARYKKKNEVEEISEEAQAELDQKFEKSRQDSLNVLSCTPNWTVLGLSEVHEINSDVSMETLTN